MTVWLVCVSINYYDTTVEEVIEVCKTEKTAEETAEEYLKSKDYENMKNFYGEEYIEIYFREREIKE